MAYRIVPKITTKHGKGAAWFHIANEKDKNDLKKYLEKGRCSKEQAHLFLTEVLGDYLSTSDLKRIAGMDLSEMKSLRETHPVRAENFKGKWYYSAEDVIKALKT